MGILTTKLSSAEIKNILTDRGYNCSESGHVTPDIFKLPGNYPWTYREARGPVRKGRDDRTLTNYPLPCAFMFVNGGLELVNEDEPPVAKYHKEILEFLGSA